MRVASGDGATGNVTARRILRDVVIAQTTHNIYSTGNNWATAGAQSDGTDRVGTATDTAVNPSTTAGTLVTWDLTDDVAAVYAATADYPAWLFEWTGTTDFTGRTWDSAEATDGNRPELILVFAAGGDTTAPTCSVSPAEDSVTSSSITVDATCSDETDASVNHYAVAVADAAAAPSPAQIAAGQDSTGSAALAACSDLAVTNAAEGQCALTGLSASTAYDVYYTVGDSAPNYLTPVLINSTTSAPAACVSDDSAPMPGDTINISGCPAFGGNITTLTSPGGDTISAESGANTTSASFIIPATSAFVSGQSMQDTRWAASGTWTVGDGSTTENITLEVTPPDTDGPDDWFFTLTTPAGDSVCPVAAVAGDEAFVERVTGTSMVVLDNCAVSASDDWEVDARIWDQSANGGAGQWSSVLNTVLDSTPPSGYTISIDQASIDETNDDALTITWAGAEVGADWDICISSSGGGTPVCLDGTIATATDQVGPFDVTDLPDGTLTATGYLTDPSSNQGADETDTVTKDTTNPPSGYSVNITGATYNAQSCQNFEFTWAGAEIGATYGCAVTSSGGAGSVAINGAISSADQEEGPTNVCGLPDGTLTLTCALTNGDGTGADATDTATLDTDLPALSSATVATNGNSITLAFSEAVTGQGGWTTNLSGVTLTYSSGDGTDTHVYTTSRTVGSHETGTITYTPGSLVDDAGNALAAIAGGTLTNNSTADTIPPTFESAAVPSAGTSLVVTFSEAVTQGGSYSDGDWTVTASGGAVTLTYSSGDTTDEHTFTTSRTIGIGETITLDWAGTANGLEDGAGNDLAAFSDEPVTNSSTQDLTPPTAVSARINAANMTVFFSEEPFQGAGYDNADWTLTCSGGAVSPTLLGIGSISILFSLSREPANDETCTLAHDGSANSIEDAAGNDLQAFSGLAVSFPSTDNCPRLLPSPIRAPIKSPVRLPVCAN